ncbi:hypothetical protein F0562_029365 [Nyssa sinensis]|uniref:Peptidase A1 domain-containing protein n=1 Tax=Nyssa sinensis TaxID=561372 RepID=A0A5J5B4Z4_9ASTE|nr:hypothetical protein F0562_029365 [Nyssa sinensis]
MLQYCQHSDKPLSSPMASSQTQVLYLFLLSLVSLTFSQTPIQPTALVLPISKHASSLQYVTRISQRTPLVPINVVVDLGGPFLWVGCGSTYNSSSYRSAGCHSALCSLAHANRPICSNNNTCILFSENVFTSKVSAGDLSEDVLSLPSTNGLNPTSIVSIPQFLFLCAPELLLEGLASGAKGVAGFGHSHFGLPTQLSTEFNFSRKFSICLPPSTDSDGVIFLGDGPYVLLPGIDVSKLLIFTPLVIKMAPKPNNSIETSSPHEYYIRVRSIRVNGKKVPLNSSLLSINSRGKGGTKISTVNAFTVLEASIYSSLTQVFIQEAMAANVTRVAPMAPFDVCFSTKNMGNDVACLGFLNGGLNPKTSIIIGGHQLEDNLLQFDLVSSRLGFTSSLLLRETSCVYFNFTSIV